MTEAERAAIASEETGNVDDSGMEAEHDSGPAEIEVPFDPTKIDIIVKTMAVSSLLERLKNCELNLTPDFQRQANVWDEKRKSRLIESILLRIPLPSFYFSEDDDGSYAVVDGLQRLCAVFHYMSRETLQAATGARLYTLKLVGLQYLKELEGKTFLDLDRKFQRRINELEIAANIIRASTPSAVKFNVFARLNQGGVPLNAQEIRNAIYPGDWRNRVREMSTCREFLEATERRIRTERQQDMELVLRFVALWQLGSPYKRRINQTLDEFLNSVVENVLSKWSVSNWAVANEVFGKVLISARKIFREHVFRKSSGNQYRTPLNRGLFEAQLVVLAALSQDQLDRLIASREDFISLVSKELRYNDDFSRSLLYATGSAEASNSRIETLTKIVNEVLDA